MKSEERKLWNFVEWGRPLNRLSVETFQGVNRPDESELDF